MTGNRTVHPPLEASRWPILRKWARLDDLCDGVFDCPHSTPDLTDIGPFVVRSQDVRSGVFRLDEAGRVSETTYNERIARAEPKSGDLFYSREGTYFGIAAEVPKDARVCLGQRMVLIRPNAGKLNTRFLRFWLNSPILSRHIHGFRDGTVAERLNMPTIRGLPVPIFDRAEQDRIARILGALDDKIDLNRRMNGTLEAMARAIFKDWFVDFGPTRAKMENRAPYLAPEVWALFPDKLDSEGKPITWQELTLGAEFKVTMGQSPPGNTYNENGEGLPFFQGRSDFGFRYPTRRVFCTAPARLGRQDDTLVSVRAPVGDINMAWEDCCIGRGIAAIRHKSGHRGFTYYALWSLQSELSIYEHTGTVFGAINKRQFDSLKLVAPQSSAVDAFERTIAALDDRIRLNDEENIALREARDLLLPKLMSGEVRVKDAEKMAARVA